MEGKRRRTKLEKREVRFSSQQHKQQDQHLEEGPDRLDKQQGSRREEVKLSKFQDKHVVEGGEQQQDGGDEEGGRPGEDEGGDSEGSQRGGKFHFLISEKK